MVTFILSILFGSQVSVASELENCIKIFEDLGDINSSFMCDDPETVKTSQMTGFQSCLKTYKDLGDLDWSFKCGDSETVKISQMTGFKSCLQVYKELGDPHWSYMCNQHVKVQVSQLSGFKNCLQVHKDLRNPYWSLACDGPEEVKASEMTGFKSCLQTFKELGDQNWSNWCIQTLIVSNFEDPTNIECMKDWYKSKGLKKYSPSSNCVSFLSTWIKNEVQSTSDTNNCDSHDCTSPLVNQTEAGKASMTQDNLEIKNSGTHIINQ